MSTPSRFIVVDDDPTSNMICHFILKGFSPGAGINLFTEPEAALEALGSSPGGLTAESPAVLFLDLNMPSMTGWDFLEELGKTDSQVMERLTIYILSSSLDAGDMEKAENHPLVTGFLSKPLTMGFLMQEFSQG
jgi:two-component system chemotaxis response regulator CheY